MTRVTVAPNARSRDLAGEAVVLHLDTGECFALDRTGNRAWQLIAELGDLDRVASVLASEYGAPLHIVAADLDRLVQELLQRNLIRLDET